MGRLSIGGSKWHVEIFYALTFLIGCSKGLINEQAELHRGSQLRFGIRINPEEPISEGSKVSLYEMLS